MDDQQAVKMMYKVKEGRVETQHYGLNLARAVGLPESLLERAREVAGKLERDREEKMQRSKAAVTAQRRVLVLRLLETLVQAREGRMEGEVLKRWLLGVQADFIERMGVLGAEGGDAEEEDDGMEDEEGGDGEEE